MPDVNDVLEMDFLELGEPIPETPPQNTNEEEVDAPVDMGEEASDNTDDSKQKDKTDTSEKKNITRTGNDNIDQQQNSGEQPKGESEESGEDSSDQEGEEQQVSLYQELIDNSGIELSDEEKASLLQTEETTEGFLKVADTLASKRAENRFMNLMEQYPETAKVLQYEMNGGDPRDYFNTHHPEVDYSELEVSEDDTQVQKEIVARSLQLQGLEEEDIQSELDDLETAGILHNRAKRSLKTLQKHQAEQKEAFEERQQKLVEQRREQAQKQFEESEQLIKQGDLKGIKIPEKKADQFISYLFDPVTEEGHSQAMLDSQKLSLEDRLMIGYLQFSGYDLTEFVKQQSNNSQVKNIREFLNKSKEKENLKSAGNNNHGREDKGSPDDIVSPF